jgi:hypothetical protein
MKNNTFKMLLRSNFKGHDWYVTSDGDVLILEMHVVGSERKWAGFPIRIADKKLKQFWEEVEE